MFFNKKERKSDLFTARSWYGFDILTIEGERLVVKVIVIFYAIWATPLSLLPLVIIVMFLCSLVMTFGRRFLDAWVEQSEKIEQKGSNFKSWTDES